MKFTGTSMRIAYVYDAVYPFVKGGVEKRVYEIGRRLAKKHEIHWFGLDWEGNLKDIEFHSVGKWKHIYSGKRRSIMEAAYFASKLLLKFHGEYDLIDCQQFPYLSCFSVRFHSSFKKIPLVITWHEFWGDYWLKYLDRIGIVGKGVESSMLNISHANVSVSRLTKRMLALRGIESTLIPNGIDYDVIRKVRPAKDKYDIIFVGRLIPEKNVTLLLDAVTVLKNEIPDLRVVIVGDGPERRSLEDKVKELGLSNNVTFRGFLKSYEEVISYIKASRTLVLPSMREGFGIVVLEANAAGIPVVTVDYQMNAAKELITSGYNGIVSRASKEKLAESILLVLEKGRKMKGNCVQNAKKYDWDKIVQQTEKFYERVLYE